MSLVILLALVSAIGAGTSLERDISGSQTDTYSLALNAGECARIDVDQNGADVVVAVKDTDGARLTETDFESRPAGTERITVVADTARTFQVVVTPTYGRLPAGKYRLTVAEIRAASQKDRDAFEAARLVRKATDETIAGKLEDSLATGLRALELGEKALGPNDPFVAFLLMKHSLHESARSRFAAARESLQRALEIAEATVGHDDLLSADIVQLLGITYRRENDFLTAERLLLDARKRIEAGLGPTHPRIATLLLSLSSLHRFLEDDRSARAELEQALEVIEKSYEKEAKVERDVIGNLGALYTDLHEYDRAEPFLRRALSAYLKTNGPDHPYVSYPLVQLAEIARERQQYDDALALLWRAQTIRENALGARNPDAVTVLTEIGAVHDARGDYAEALRFHQMSAEGLEAAVGPYNHRTVDSISRIARTYAAQGNIPCAIEYQARVNQLIDKNLELNLAIGSERQKLEYAKAMAVRMVNTLELNADRAPRDPAATELALATLLQHKGRVLDAMSQNLVAIRARLEPADQELLDRMRTKTAELAKLALSGPGKDAPAVYLAKLQRLESEKENLEAEIGTHSAVFRAQSQPATISAVRNAIPPRAALIEFALYSAKTPRYLAYVLRRHGRVQFKDLGDARAIDLAIETWRRALRDPNRPGVDELARAVDRKVMQPVRPLIEGASQLLIAPDGQLGLIPFEALVDARGRYLLERYSIGYLTSGRDLLRLRVPRPGKTPPMIVADPLFGEPVSRPAQMASLEPRRSITTGNDFSTVYFGPLAGTREEARTIHELFPESRILTGKSATKTALQHADAPIILHVATHGFFLTKAAVAAENPLIRSGLALSGANLSSTSDDGVLTALEASNLDLWGTKLVTLSACDSGVGEVRNREGVYGLRRAFFLAGAETVVMSLWPVSDYFTRHMMTAYYTNLKEGQGRGEALRQAKLAMLKRERKHPFYWASFIQSGDWTPLE